MNDSLATTAEGRSVLRMRRRLDHPAGKGVAGGYRGRAPRGVVPDVDDRGAARVGGRVRFGFGGDGTVTDVDRVRIALGEGAGHGARLVLTESGAPDAADPMNAAAAEWPRRVAALAARLA